MKAGRPAYHIRAKWITLTYPHGSRVYYELDSKGNLVSKKQDINQGQKLNVNNATASQKASTDKDENKVKPLQLNTQKVEEPKNNDNNNNNDKKDNENLADENIQDDSWIFPNDDSPPGMFDNNDIFNNDDSFSWNFL